MAQNDLTPSNVAGEDEGRKIDWPIAQARVPERVMEAIDKKAEAAGVSRGEWLRDVITAAATAA
jgi:predicted HicB family RNase H-like nuclease